MNAAGQQPASQVSARGVELVARGVASRAPWLLAAVALLSALSVLAIVDPRSGALRLHIDPSIASMIPDDDEARATLDRVTETFGTGQSILLALVADDVFRPEHLRSIQRIVERVEGLDEVFRVASLSRATSIRGEAGTVRIRPFYEEVPERPEALAELRQRALSDPIYAGNLVSRDGSTSLVTVYLLDLPEAEIVARGIDERIAAIAREEWSGDDVWVAGGPRMKAETTRILLRDLGFTFPLGVGAMCLVAFLAFRTLRGVLLPLATVAISVLWTVGFASLSIGSLSVVTIAAPAILTVVGFAYAIHVLAAYYDAAEGALGEWTHRGEAVYLALRQVTVPLFFTGVTTAAGFFSLMVSPIEAIDEFAIFGTFGVMATLVVSMTFTPAMLCLLPMPKRPLRRGGARLDRLFERLAAFDVRHRRTILALGGVTALASLVGMLRIEVGTATVDNFRRDNPVRLDFERINQHLEGANAFSIVFETTAPEAFKEPANLRAVAKVQTWLSEQPEVGGTTSIVDYVKTLHQAFADNDPTAFRIPESRDVVSQLLLLGASEELDEFVDTSFQSAHVVVRTPAMNSPDVMRLVERIEDQLHLVPSHLRASVTGDTVLLSRTMDEVALSQALSLATALLIIYAILCLLFTSPRTGLLALLPNALPVLIYFGLLGWAGISLNLTTGLVACMVLGIAVDDTIHLLAHFNAESKRHADERLGMVEALRRVGRPVTYTTLALCAGFSCLVTSEARNQIEFGVLSAVTLALAWLLDMTVTPALASGMRIVSLWDVLTLDLGQEPERSIPLFHGLRATQARVVALLCGLRELPRGEKLFHIGAKSDEMYVVIDGRLRVSVDQDGHRVELRHLERGDVVGEVGLFRGERTADVTAESDTRLLRLSREGLLRLEQRRPRIGARIYANLGEVLADRLTSLTGRVR